MDQFREGLAEILEIDTAEVTPDLRLEDHAWDSLAIVSTIALIDEVYDETVSADALAECQTVADVESLVEKKRSRAAG